MINLAYSDLDRQVIEYLSKKGYSRTEATLRAEGANQDADGNIIHTRAEDKGGPKYAIAYGKPSQSNQLP